MKNISRFLLLTTFSLGAFMTAGAQRRASSGSTAERQPSRSVSSPSRSEAVRPSAAPSRDRSFHSQQPAPRERSVAYRNPAGQPAAGGARVYARGGAPVTPSRGTTALRTPYRPTSPVRNTPVSVRNNYRYNYYGNVYGHRTYILHGPRYRVIPHYFVPFYYGGNPYYYNAGFFYGYYGGYYRPLFPPFGLRISILPVGYMPVYIGPYVYYYYNGIYYRQYGTAAYEVVDAPMGAVVSSLPQGARPVVINGENLYELNGTYYKGSIEPNGNEIYTVVGKNGVIDNTDPVVEDNMQNMQPPASLSQPSTGLQEGDIISRLPEGSSVVTINGQQLYQTPDHIFLRKEINNGAEQYRVVGK